MRCGKRLGNLKDKISSQDQSVQTLPLDEEHNHNHNNYYHTFEYPDLLASPELDASSDREVVLLPCLDEQMRKSRAWADSRLITVPLPRPPGSKEIRDRPIVEIELILELS